MAKQAAVAVPCNGRGCSHKEHCDLYEKHAADVHGWWDSDDGWTCPEWRPKAKVETDDDDGLELF